VQQPAKSISPTHLCVNGKWCFFELSSLRWLELQRTGRSLSVVMANVDLEDALEVATGEDEQPVQALGPNGSDPSLAESVGARCPDGSADHLEPFACEHVIERTAELGVAVVDEERNGCSRSSRWNVKFLACWTTQAPSGVVVQPARWTRLVASSMNTTT
jgi:hypothetical protein